jgi:hypothetical protein
LAILKAIKLAQLDPDRAKIVDIRDSRRAAGDSAVNDQAAEESENGD